MTEEADAAPYILTLMLDEAAQARFDALRRAHFPPERLHIGAHVTLFHALPRDPRVQENLASAAAIAEIPVRVAKLRFLGRGVAFGLESDRLRRLRETLRQAWSARLTAQDGQAWQPHVTIQNKVAPHEARALFTALSAEFQPYDVTATGLALWIYRGGPWEEAGRFPFYIPSARR